jgi:hypothetical protein
VTSLRERFRQRRAAAAPVTAAHAAPVAARAAVPVDAVAASPANAVEIQALRRHLRRSAQSFSLVFVVVNHTPVRDWLVDSLTAAGDALAVRVQRGEGGPVPQIEAAIDRHGAAPRAVVLVGLEDLVLGGDAGALDNLNLNRDYLARRIACPLVVIGPASLAAAVSTAATDLWSVRSNVFELTGDAGTGLTSVEDSAGRRTWDATPEDRAAHARLLDDLAAEAAEHGESDPRFLAALAVARAEAAALAHRHDDAEARYHEALPIYRQIGDRLGEANTLQALGDAALSLDRYDDAEARYHEALPIYRQIGARLGEANTLLGQGRLRRAVGDVPAAAENLRDAARIYRAIGVTRWAEIAAGEADAAHAAAS